ncbi:MAG: ABC transporter ATP-binding protein/permease [Eubacterium sp.]|nr:ABC transporter ATP-binding protein/permease [Eubacterium sp.]
MLEIRNIKKEYRTAGLVQMALDGVSMNLRDNEFVAVLGPSGSGKTTFLNIIGGLDQADSGELVINGVSTAKYRDRDWDTYRNHTIGFVFQSYNLIPHQTVLRNVELALTISGISGNQRRIRAEEALREVGLEEHIHKLPMQLSGGQMQRVAIARALVNDPDIVLADEPTGALDSQTGIQVMELLKKVAQDRLVVMVTHNPELADQYATRIINLKDGKVIADSDPFDPAAAASVITPADGTAAAPLRSGSVALRPDADVSAGMHKRKAKKGRASMSFFTALTLSFNNLMTKKGRTLLVAFAGSIGIIGIALILSLSNGVNKYIDSVEEETLSEYPVQIQDTGFDLASIMSTAEGIGEGGKDAAKKKKSVSTNGKGVPGSAVDEMDEYGEKIGEMKTITEIFSKSNSNDLGAFKDFLESKKSGIKKYTSAIEYRYSVVPLIYREDPDKTFRQVNPDRSFAAIGLTGSSGTSNSLMSLMMSTDSFNALPADDRMYKDQYDLVAGHWPEDEHDLVLILSSTGDVSDLVLYMMGERDPDELTEAVKKFAKGDEVTVDTEDREFDSSYFMGQEFRLIINSDCYKYDSDKDIYIDKQDDEDFMNNVAAKSEKLRIAGIVKPSPDSNIASLTIGIGYSPDLIYHIISKSKKSDIVKAQKADKSRNVLTGKDFGDNDNSDFDMQDVMSVDEKKLQSAFSFDQNALKIDPSKLPQPDKDDFDMSSVMKAGDPKKSEKAMSKMMTDIMKGYAKYVQKQQSEAADPSKMAEGFAAFMQTEEAQAVLAQLAAATSQEELTEILGLLYMKYTQYAMAEGSANEVDMGAMMAKYMETKEAQKIISKATSSMMPDMNGVGKKMQEKITSGMKKYMTKYMKAAMGQVASGLKNAMSVDPQAFADAIQMDMDEDDLTQMISQMMTKGTATYEDNMKNFGYADLKKPSMIMIYPKDFESKEKVTAIIDNYNDRMKKTGEDDKVITYSDIVGTLMSSVTDIINQLSMILIAFVAISLVVSSIMIGVITYISVLERKKEIGILRAMGASKGNVANVFNAETFIIGLLAGLLGIGISLALLIPGNYIIQTLAEGTRMRAQMPAGAAVILVLLSIVLTLIGGWIPSRKAAKSDPVTALRTE